MQLRSVNVNGNATRLNLSTWIARLSRTCAGVSFPALGGGGGIWGKLTASIWQLRRWFKNGCGESVGSSCWLHLVSRLDDWKICWGIRCYVLGVVY